MSQADAASACGFKHRTDYARYEQGKSNPSNFAYAAGLLMAVKTPENVIKKNFFKGREKPNPAPAEMTDREEALIQWFDNQLSRCFDPRCRNKIEAVATLCYALEFQWADWRDSSELRSWVEETTGSCSTKQAISQRIKSYQKSFSDACSGIKKTDTRLKESEVLKMIDYHRGEAQDHISQIEKLKKKIA